MRNQMIGFRPTYKEKVSAEYIRNTALSVTSLLRSRAYDFISVIIVSLSSYLVSLIYIFINHMPQEKPYNHIVVNR